MLSTSGDKCFQLFRPYTFRESEIEADHYLSCGSFSSTFTIPGLKCFSRYQIKAHTKFPLVRDPEDNNTVLLVILKGSLKVNGQVAKEGEVFLSPKQIGGNEQIDAEFLRIVLEGKHDKSELKDALFTSQKIKLIKKDLSENEILQLTGKAYVLVLTGKCSIADSKSAVYEGQCILLKKPTALTGADKASVLFYLTWL